MVKTYVDNAQNRRLDRVGKPIGTMAQPSSASNENVYVDNDMNRRLGRVGQPHGTAVVHKKHAHSPKYAAGGTNSPSPGMNRVPSGNENSSTSTSKTYVDNAQNRKLGRVGQPLGTAVVPATRVHSPKGAARATNIPPPGLNRVPSGNENSSTSTSKTYVDNAQNRKLERVGQPLGTAVVPATRAHSPKSAARATNIPSPGLNREPSGNKNSSTSTSKTYVDNAQNRRLGRVGQPHGTAVVSKCGQRSLSSVSTDTVTLNNSSPCTRTRSLSPVSTVHFNRNENDSGSRTNRESENYPESKSNACDGHYQRHTSHPSHGELEEEGKGTIKNEKRYVDNKYNRNLGRVGLLHGEAVVYKNGNGTKKPNDNEIVYVDNPQNRKLSRVGLPLGTRVYSKITKDVTTRVYADTPLNKRLGRVGKPQGSVPRRSIITDKIPDMIEKLRNQDDAEAEATRNGADELDDFSEPKDPTQAALQHAICHRNRLRAEQSWQKTTKEPPKTETAILKDYKGKKIAFDELKLHTRIGRGGFGEVYFAKWQETVVAVKKLRTEKFTDKNIITFAEEVMKFCELNHPNIVKFIGACTKMPDVCIVMEYMQYSLFDAIHVRKIEFTEEEILSITQQICKGITYLHERRIAHCDIKTANILMDYVENNICEAKITDFGLSMIIQNSSLSLSHDFVRHVGTPRYSAPEIIRGEVLSARDMMHADVYSLGLVLFEIIYSEEPYHDFTAVQMLKQVGQEGVTPEISNEVMVDQNVLEIIHMAWKFEPHLRPKARNISDVLNRSLRIFIEHEC